MYTGSVTEINGIRAADVVIHDANGNIISTFSDNVPGPATAATDTFDAANTFANSAVVLLLAANPARKQFSLYNSMNKSLAVGYANTVSNTAYAMPLAQAGAYESKVGCYTGAVYGVAIGVPNAGSVSVTEFV